MGVTRRGSATPQPDWNSRQWAQYFEDQIVTPDDGTVTPATLAPETVTQIGDTASDAAGTAINAHIAAPDPHPQYAAHAEVNAAANNAQAAAEATGAVVLAAHVAAADPHPVYTTGTELSAAIAAHAAAVDPHPVYLTQPEGDARYPHTLSDFADDAAAAGGGVAVGSFYRTGSAVKTRVS